MAFAKGRKPFSSPDQSGPRDGDTSGDPTTNGGNPMAAAPNIPDHAEALERADNGQRLALAMQREVMAVADPPMPEAERLVGELGRRLSDVEDILAALGQRVGSEHVLASAAVGAAGMIATELRQQIPTLTQAMRDLERGL